MMMTPSTSHVRTTLLAAMSAAVACVASAQTDSTTPAVDAQPAGDAQTATISVRSNLVVVPALVKTKSGDIVFTLGKDDFQLTDNGIPQKLRLEEDTGGEPLALVIVVETGSDGAEKLHQYGQLGALLDNVIGAVPRKVAVVGFDSAPTVEQPFTPSLNAVNITLGSLQPGDQKAAIYDALSFAVEMLRKQPTSYRRAILLFSETLDHGSHTSLVDTLHAVADTNTTIYTVSFNSTKAELKHGGAISSSHDPGPAHGCFAHDDTIAPAMQPTRSQQNFDCFAQLIPPLRLAKMAAIALGNSMRRNVPETVSKLTGGEYYSFNNEKSMQRALLTIANHVPNRYVLSFRPSSPTTGFHTIQLTLPDHVNLRVEARNGYWIDDPNGAPEVTPSDTPDLPKNAAPVPPQ
ncbi:VWFA-related domain-containing protein [Bryocella elongata]|uniref:VWFA-related domain-containing protein n=1 Tax=Bryocella elongata TaxID=863522 RepID=A0A1H6A2W1_9BACT|nr:VWA domain-containing protein [Bryocella elongata]SEG43093.1 VWFA-related domain-containing protein [Bryocella elongata]